ncbi:hypothetical protein AK830_g6454 [Neonectria ditissima]|uniref:Uncharacterized protein n=1 Tax=Neonectria ditissima TaxID=78410 RepID=A0A0P7B0G6_9HYPO|nr:hypothetical protein AK830_g6454 [Neonectria ditissima]
MPKRTARAIADAAVPSPESTDQVHAQGPGKRRKLRRPQKRDPSSPEMEDKVDQTKPLGGEEVSPQDLHMKALNNLNSGNNPGDEPGDEPGVEPGDDVMAPEPSTQFPAIRSPSPPIGDDEEPLRPSSPEPVDNVGVGDVVATLESSAQVPIPDPPADSIQDNKIPQPFDVLETGDDTEATDPDAQVSTSHPSINPEIPSHAKLHTRVREEDYVLIAMQQARMNGLRVKSHEQILSNWKLLCIRVRLLAERVAKGQSLAWADLGPDTQRKVGRWTSKAKEYLEDDNKKHLLLQACIWHAVDEKVLSSDWSMRWSSGLLASFGNMRQAFESKIDKPWGFHRLGPAYRCWLMISNTLMTNATRTPVRYNEDILARRIADDLSKLTGADYDKFASFVDLFEMTDVTGAVAAVDEVLQESCFKYWVAWQPRPADNKCVSERLWGFPMQEMMETAEGNDLEGRGKPVQLVVQPWLVADDQQTKVEWIPPPASQLQFRIVHPMRVDVGCASGKE